MDLSEGYRRVSDGVDRAVVHADHAAVPLSTWWGEGSALVDAKGRGGVQSVRLDSGLDVVLRDYRRGGAIGWLLRRWFFDGQRAARELNVLARLREAGVPVVEPVAAVSRRRYGLYRLRLVTTLAVDAKPLPAFVAQYPELRHRAIGEAGRVVCEAFNRGLLHRDLHPDNMIARRRGKGVEVLLLDLDRAELVGSLSDEQRAKMLLRMVRYLERHAASMPVLSQATDIMRFLRGYGLGDQERRALVEALLPTYRRTVARHRLSW